MGADGPGLAGVHLYAHLGIESRLVDATTVESVLPVSEAVMVAGGMRTTPFGLAMEHGMPLLARVVALPVVVSVHLRAPAADGGEVRVQNRLVRLGRTLMVTEAVFLDRSDRTVGFGTITWSVRGGSQEAPPPVTSVAPRSDTAPRQGILDAIGVKPLPAEEGCQLSGVTPDVAGPGGILHAGAVHLLCEEAALIAGRARMSTRPVWTRDSVLHLVGAGRAGPFTATASTLVPGDEGTDCRAMLRDEGNAGRVLALADVRLAGGRAV